MIALLADLALADVAICFPGPPEASVPADGATGVPLDAQPKVSLANDCTFGVATYTLQLRDTAGGLFASTELASDSGGFATLVPADLLAAQTQFEVSVNGDDGTTALYRFTTGDALAAGLDGEPSADVVATWDARHSLGHYIVDVSPAADPDESSILAVRHGTTEVAAPADRDPVHFDFGGFGDDRKKCVEVEQIALNGESAVIDACDHGCNSARGPIGGIAVLLAGLMIRRKRC